MPLTRSRLCTVAKARTTTIFMCNFHTPLPPMAGLRKASSAKEWWHCWWVNVSFICPTVWLSRASLPSTGIPRSIVLNKHRYVRISTILSGYSHSTYGSPRVTPREHTRRPSPSGRMQGNWTRGCTLGMFNAKPRFWLAAHGAPLDVRLELRPHVWVRDPTMPTSYCTASTNGPPSWWACPEISHPTHAENGRLPRKSGLRALLTLGTTRKCTVYLDVCERC